jgi:hypothetical protein
MLLFIFLKPITAIGQPFEPTYNQLQGKNITSYPAWPAKGYVITNDGDSIVGTITKSKKRWVGFSSLSLLMVGNIKQRIIKLLDF